MTDDSTRRPASRGLLIAVLLILALALVIARDMWELVSPLHFDTVKTLIYVRDAVTLGPATALLVAAILLMRPWNPQWLDHPKHWFVPALAGLGFATTALLAVFALLGVPAIVDEAAYLWQAQLLAGGRLTGAVGPVPDATIVQYVGDFEGKRISVFFPGSSLPLALGYQLHIVQYVDPLLIAICVAVTYWAGRRLFDARVGVIAAAFFVISPFTLFQGASFFGQVWTALLVVPAFTLALTLRRTWEPVAVGFLVAAAALGRPASAATCAIAIAVIWIADAIKGRRMGTVLRPGLLAILGAVVPVVAFFGFNHALTGDWLQTAHRLLLPDETAQLGLRSVRNALLNIAGLAGDFNGLVLLGPLLLIPAWRTRSRPVLLITVYGIIHLIGYSLYYNHGISYGPRYMFEVSPLLLVAASFGLVQVKRLDERIPALLVAATVIVAGGVVPGRVGIFHDRAEYLDLSAIDEAYGKVPTLVFVDPGPYRFPDPMYPAFVYNGPVPGSRPLVFVRDTGADRCQVAKEFPGRKAFFLSTDERAGGASVIGALHPLPSCPW